MGALSARAYAIARAPLATAKVGTGVLYRAIGASSLDLRRPEAQVVLQQLLATAALQRGAFRTLEIG